MKVIGVVGMPGSGKGVVTKVAEDMDIAIIRMGDVVREEAKKRKKDVGKVAIMLRREYGDSFIAKTCVDRIKKLNINKIMIEGIRSLDEVETFKNNFEDFKVIAIHSSPKTRFRRLKRRNRVDDPKNILEFKERDERELGFGIGDAIATSDYMIVNEGPLEKFKRDIRGILDNEN